ncbi:hypothetical protein B566_EDAN012321 [Ephemera danica]|nr:hypothetical protein B566_EDAN012321 [Ephemera danica]
MKLWCSLVFQLSVFIAVQSCARRESCKPRNIDEKCSATCPHGPSGSEQIVCATDSERNVTCTPGMSGVCTISCPDGKYGKQLKQCGSSSFIVVPEHDEKTIEVEIQNENKFDHYDEDRTLVDTSHTAMVELDVQRVLPGANLHFYFRRHVHSQLSSRLFT